MLRIKYKIREASRECEEMEAWIKSGMLNFLNFSKPLFRKTQQHPSKTVHGHASWFKDNHNCCTHWFTGAVIREDPETSLDRCNESHRAWKGQKSVAIAVAMFCTLLCHLKSRASLGPSTQLKSWFWVSWFLTGKGYFSSYSSMGNKLRLKFIMKSWSIKFYLGWSLTTPTVIMCRPKMVLLFIHWRKCKESAVTFTEFWPANFWPSSSPDLNSPRLRRVVLAGALNHQNLESKCRPPWAYAKCGRQWRRIYWANCIFKPL